MNCFPQYYANQQAKITDTNRIRTTIHTHTHTQTSQTDRHAARTHTHIPTDIQTIHIKSTVGDRISNDESESGRAVRSNHRFCFSRGRDKPAEQLPFEWNNSMAEELRAEYETEPYIKTYCMGGRSKWLPVSKKAFYNSFYVSLTSAT